MTEDAERSLKAYSYIHAQLIIRRIYREFGIELGRSTPGRMVADEYGGEIAGEALGALFAFVDEITAVLQFLSWGLLPRITEPQADEDIFYRICAKAVANLASIRSLCQLGFDGNARIQLRLHYETMVLWARLRIDLSAREAFRAAVTPEAANKFWHTHVKRRKSEDVVTVFSAAHGGWIGAAEAAPRRIGTLLGVSSHPSHLEMIFNAREDLESPRKEHIVVRGPTPSSHFTLGSAIWASTLPFHIPPAPLMEIEPMPGWRPPEAEVLQSASWDADYYKRLQEVILALFTVSQPVLDALKETNGGDAQTHRSPP